MNVLALLRMAAQLLTMRAQSIYARHRTRIQLALLVVLLSRALRPVVLRALRQLHYHATAEEPRLYYVHTPENERLLSRCLTITTKKYYPLWYLFNGHLQTLRLSREMKTTHPLIHYERQTLDLPDGGIISLDWAFPRRPDGTIPRVSELDPTRKTMLLLPGLTGGSGEFYIRCTVHRMLALGWQVVVANARGCAETPLKTAKLFCCAYTDDLRFVVGHFHATYGFSTATTTFVIVGFSMGSNVLIKYLGEEREDVRDIITAGMSIGNPFDLVECSRNLNSSLFNRATYDAALNANLKELFFERSNAHEIFATHPQVDLAALRHASNLTEFDDRLTRVIFEYESVHHYYSDASSRTRIPHIDVPVLCLNAEDDPISTRGAIPYDDVQTNDKVILCVTKAGGHLAFYEGEMMDDKEQGEERTTPRVWSVKVIAEYAESVHLERLEQQADRA